MFKHLNQCSLLPKVYHCIAYILKSQTNSVQAAKEIWLSSFVASFKLPNLSELQVVRL